MAFSESCESNSRKVEHLRRIKTNGLAFTFNNHRNVLFLFSTLSVLFSLQIIICLQFISKSKIQM